MKDLQSGDFDECHWRMQVILTVLRSHQDFYMRALDVLSGMYAGVEEDELGPFSFLEYVLHLCAPSFWGDEFTLLAQAITLNSQLSVLNQYGQNLTWAHYLPIGGPDEEDLSNSVIKLHFCDSFYSGIGEDFAAVLRLRAAVREMLLRFFTNPLRFSAFSLQHTLGLVRTLSCR